MNNSILTRLSLAADRERSFVINESGSTRSVSVKLPKMELVKFNGDVLKWQEFWDSFQSSVHENQTIKSIDKMNYLKIQLQGEAKQSIVGLAATNDNYDVAIKILMERFGNKQQVIDAHYTALSKLSPATLQTNKLRSVFDNIEQHLHSLEALGEDIEHRHFVSLIRAKLPSEVIFRLEEINSGKEWSTKLLRERINHYLIARETAESYSTVSLNKLKNESLATKSHSTTEVLLSSSADKKNREPKCAYCERRHWSDKCRTFPTIEERKEKILGNCFGCLKSGHSIHNCDRTKACHYCNQENSHHSSLCPTKFSL